jgi:predicted nucleotide-binding protein
MSREKAVMVVVSRDAGLLRPSDITGLISKEHVADSVAESISPYAIDEFGE